MALLGRDTTVTGLLPAGALLLETFEGREELGIPFRYELTLLSDDPSIPVDKVLGQPLTIQLKLDTGGVRFFNGIVTYFAKTGLTVKHTRYAAVLNPALALFDCTRDCRAFCEADSAGADGAGQTRRNALDIVTEVLGEHGFTDLEARSIGDHVYRPRKYCVQYRESDLNFVQRLLEEEGIYYFFKHEERKHVLVLADSSAAHAKAPGYPTICYLPKENRQGREGEHFWSLTVAGGLYPGAYAVLRGYDYGKVRQRQMHIEKTTSARPQPGTAFEDYDCPGGFLDETSAKEESEIRHQLGQVASTTIEVEGNTMGVGVGHLVKLERSAAHEVRSPFWSDDQLDTEYLVTSAVYSIRVDQYETGDVIGGDEPFRATYTLLDNRIPFRPARTALKPKIEGPQTALVVGPPGDDIHTDKLGRVKVQFDWDRTGEHDGAASCWVRVAQLWAGKQWGAIHLPRVGQEVIVDFLDGDPDRPIVTGRVYNADHMPPYDLPANRTQSGIKTRSSKDGTANNFNELRFEDGKGKEELYLHAERDLAVVVKNDERRSVKHDRTVTVDNDERILIARNQTVDVKGDATLRVRGKRGATVDLDEALTVSGHRTERVDKNLTTTVGGDRACDIAGAGTVHVGKSCTVTVGGDRTQDIASNDLLKVGKKLVIEAGQEILFKTGDATLTLSSDGTITLQGGDLRFKATGDFHAKASGNAIIKGSKIGGNC